MENMEYKYEIMDGFRKNSKLLILTDEKQVFRKNYVYLEFTRYVCYFKSCKVTDYLRKDGVCEPLCLDIQH